MLPSAGTALKSCRLLVVDGTSLQGPGSEGTDYRVHLALDLVSLTLHEMQVTGADGGESLARYPWQAGDIALTDRGYNHPRVILELHERQVRVIVRLVPTAMPLYLREEGDGQFDPGSARLDMVGHLRGAAGDTVTVAVWLRGGASSGQGWVHAARLPPEVAEAIGVGKAHNLPSLRTVLAVLPHTALQSAVSTSGRIGERLPKGDSIVRVTASIRNSLTGSWP